MFTTALTAQVTHDKITQVEAAVSHDDLLFVFTISFFFRN